MAKDPAFLFYPADWIIGTLELTSAAKGAYIDLLCAQHNKGDLPTDTKMLARLARMGHDEFLNIWVEIETKFDRSVYQTVDRSVDRLHNRRLTQCMTDRYTKGLTNTIIGTFASVLGRNRYNQEEYQYLRKIFDVNFFLDFKKEEIKQRVTEWVTDSLTDRYTIRSTDRLTDRLTNGMESIININGNINVTENENEDINEDYSKLKKIKKDTENDFSAFWKLYDKKVDKKACERGWKALNEAEKRKIIDYLPAYVASTPDKQHRKDPKTFLNNESWENEIVHKLKFNNYGTTKKSIASTLQVRQNQDFGEL